MAQWLRLWIPNPGFLFSKPLGVSKVDLAFCPSVVDEMSTRTHKDLMIKSKLSPFSGSVALEQFKLTCKKGPWSFLKFFFCAMIGRTYLVLVCVICSRLEYSSWLFSSFYMVWNVFSFISRCLSTATENKRHPICAYRCMQNNNLKNESNQC